MEIINTSKKKIMNAMNNIGMDESSFVLRFKNNPKAKPIKAVFGKKNIKLKHLLQWEAKYPKVKI